MSLKKKKNNNHNHSRLLAASVHLTMTFMQRNPQRIKDIHLNSSQIPLELKILMLLTAISAA